jgi:hypothetical protein
MQSTPARDPIHQDLANALAMHREGELNSAAQLYRSVRCCVEA